MKKSVVNVILIVIAIILIVLTIMIVNDRGRSSGSGGLATDYEVSAFNSTFASYLGTQKKSAVKELLEEIATSNETQENTDGHVIAVTLVDKNGNYILSATTEASSIYECMSNVDSSKKYKVTVTAVDSDGYFSAMEIVEKNYCENHQDELALYSTFNQQFSYYYTSYYGRDGSVIKRLLKAISTSNETQENTDGHLIKVTLIDEDGNYLLESATDATSINGCISKVSDSNVYVAKMTAADSEGYYTAIEIIESASSKFNSTFKKYIGRQYYDIEELLKELATNNEIQENTDGHLIEVTFIDENGNYLLENETDATTIYECISKVKITGYVVKSVAYDSEDCFKNIFTSCDSEGYYTTMTIIEREYYDKTKKY